MLIILGHALIKNSLSRLHSTFSLSTFELFNDASQSHGLCKWKNAVTAYCKVFYQPFPWKTRKYRENVMVGDLRSKIQTRDIHIYCEVHLEF
jgi:hypothetical protein